MHGNQKINLAAGIYPGRKVTTFYQDLTQLNMELMKKCAEITMYK